MDLEQFTRENAPKEGGDGFQLENGKLLDVALDGSVMAKAGSMVAYEGDISFDRKSAGGLTGMIKKAATGEGSVMMEATGRGNLYLADQGKKVQILSLDPGEEISVNGNDVLAFESSVGWDIKTIDSIAGAATGGLFNVYLEGPGNVAITTHGEPLVLETPVTTDPDATVAWSSAVSPGVKTDRSIKGFLGKSSGETYQLDFASPGGFVIVQPYEEVGPTQ
ncbi:AIM24 family protein [Haloarchaeobius sp. DT45]|uniref:AIM24 family protein n=1 Tax=Haloarchaeobius sp. DT45 TaxID=3446116 RepID=UPI003F6AF6CA